MERVTIAESVPVILADKFDASVNQAPDRTERFAPSLALTTFDFEHGMTVVAAVIAPV
jgi:hypothetical protein